MYPARDRSGGQVQLRSAFTTNGVSTPTVQRGNHFTVTRTGVGLFRVRLANPPDTYPQFDHYDCDIHGSAIAGYQAQVVAESSTDSSGAYIDIQVYDGANAAVETTGKIVCFSVSLRVWSAAVPN